MQPKQPLQPSRTVSSRIVPLLLHTLLCVLPAAPASAQGTAVAACAAAGAAGAARPAAADLSGLHAAERQRAEAIGGRNVAALRNLISGDYYHVETNGRVRTKTEFLQLLERDDFEFRSYVVDDMEIRLFDGGRAALVAGRFHAALQAPDGQPGPRTLRGRYVRLWTLSPEGWRNTMQQSTEIRPVPSRRAARKQP